MHGMGPEMPTSPGSCSTDSERLSSPEYLAQLIKDKRTLQVFPNAFAHVERILDEEIARVRSSVLYLGTNVEPLNLPEPLGPIVTLTEKLTVPTKEYPDFNFVGRLLGPRGMTAKQLELDTGCKILVRGQGSLRDKKKEEQMKGKAKWEHLNEDLHVLINVEDAKNRANLKMKRAVDEIKKLLVPSVEGDDELKKKQLMELALLNGTYKGYNNVFMPGGGNHFAPPGSMLALPMMVRSPEHAGAPIFLPPLMPLPGGHHFFTGPLSPIPSPATFNGTPLHHPPPPALMSPPGGEQGAPPPPTGGFFYQFEPCLLSPASPMMEFAVSPLDYGRQQMQQQQQLMQHQQHSVSYAR